MNFIQKMSRMWRKIIHRHGIMNSTPTNRIGCCGKPLRRINCEARAKRFDIRSASDEAANRV